MFEFLDRGWHAHRCARSAWRCRERVLMEPIIIDIGLQKGIVGPTLFSMLVIMAVVTTVMPTPVFRLVYGRKAREAGELGAMSVAA
jgi:hypothetical protein